MLTLQRPCYVQDADFDFTETTLGLVTDDNAESAVNVFTPDC